MLPEDDLPTMIGMHQYQFVGTGSAQAALDGKFLANQVPF